MSMPGKEAIHSFQEEEAIRKRAEEIYEQEGRVAGHDEENWLRAEAEVTAEAASKNPTRCARILIKANGSLITVQYDPQTTDSRPGELAGQPGRICIDNDRTVITRKNGGVLETSILKRYVRGSTRTTSR